jgi:hypothetical protein
MVVILHKLINSEVIRNFSKPTSIHAERIRIGFSYNDPPNLARQVLKTTALETIVTYEVKFFIRDYGEIEQIRERFMTRVWYAAKRSNLSIPFPIRTLYHYHGPSSQKKRLATKFNESLQAIPAYVPINREEAQQSTASLGLALQHCERPGDDVCPPGQRRRNRTVYVAKR